MKVSIREVIGFLCGCVALISAGLFAYTALILNDPNFSLGVTTAMCGSSMIILKTY